MIYTILLALVGLIMFYYVHFINDIKIFLPLAIFSRVLQGTGTCLGMIILYSEIPLIYKEDLD